MQPLRCRLVFSDELEWLYGVWLRYILTAWVWILPALLSWNLFRHSCRLLYKLCCRIVFICSSINVPFLLCRYIFN